MVTQPEHYGSRRDRLLAFMAFLPALLAVIVLTIAMWKLDNERHQQVLENERAATEERITRIAGKIAAEIRGDFKLGEGLISAISLEPDMTQERFAALASGIFERNPNLRLIAAAPDLVIRMIYPEQGNLAAIGMDYKTNQQQREAALKTLSLRNPLVTGPVELVQGGTGLVVRYPVFRRDDGRNWGIFSTVIDLGKLYEEAGIPEALKDIDLAISKHEGDGPVVTFYETRDFSTENPVSLKVDLGYVDWTLSAVPKSGWPQSSSILDRLRLEALGIALCIVLPLLWAGLLLRRSQRNTHALQLREQEMHQLSKRLEMALTASDIGVWELDTQSGDLQWDARLRQMFFAAPGQDRFTFEDWQRAVHPQDLPHAQASLGEAVAAETKFSVDFRTLRADGVIRHVRAMGIYEGGKVVGINWDVTRDVLLNQELRDAKAQTEQQNDELRAARASLEYLSLHDALTGLPNRRYLDTYLSGKEREKTEERLAVLHLDLDRFKEINDTLGHATGDTLLKHVGERLLRALEAGEFVARVGGDEFVVVVCGKEPASRARALATHIVTCMATPFDIDGTPCRIGCSVGLAVQEPGDGAPKNLVVNADIALYEAKKQGRGRVAQFTNRLKQAAVQLKALADEFSTGLEQDQFQLAFQPQFDAHTLRIVGVEALVRWNHPTRGLLSPAAFLPVATDLNKVGKLDAIVLEKGLRQFEGWRAQGLRIPRLSVNISRDRLRDKTLFDHLASLEFDPEILSFELLESISFEDIDPELKLAIEQLKRMKIGIEIDDFGTGHASIVNLLELAPDRLKVDRKLVASIEASGARRRLVASIIEIGRALGIEIIAEGVESMQQAKILGDLGCNILQGYAFARPMTASDFFDFAMAWAPRQDVSVEQTRTVLRQDNA